MALSAQDIGRLNLWAHQVAGIRVIKRYLFAAPLQAAPAALINVPTGGGKSAIIGASIHGPGFQGTALVLTPRTSLRRQLFQDLSGVRGVLTGAPKEKLRIVREAKSAAELIRHLGKADAIVATIQLLHKMVKDGAILKQINAEVRTVYVDEGHYEPAAGWSRAIRSIDRPTILLTATPYRNDFRDFALDPASIHVTRYEDLRTARLLRELKIVTGTHTSDPDEFVRLVLGSFHREVGTLPTSDKRLIIRCSSKANIEAIQRSLRNYAAGAIRSLGVHQKFSDPRAGVDTDPPTLRHPPEPASRDEAVWVHQWKLLEGIDSEKFIAVATFQPFGSARALIQQIGRILRNPSGNRPEKALLIDFTDGRQERQWNCYIAFDRNLTSARLSDGLQEVSASFDVGAPNTVYADGEFRTKLIIGGAAARDIEKSLRLPLRCSVLETSLADGIKKLEALTKERLLEGECNFQFYDLGDDVMLVIFVRAGTSPYLTDHYYVERSLNVMAAIQVGNRIVVTDTSRTGLPQDVLTFVGRPITREDLNRVLDLTADTVFTEVSSRSMVLGGSGIRARSTQASSLEGSAPLLDDFMFAPTSITAIDRSRFASKRRELGFATARITDGAPLASYESWKAWAKDLVGKSAQSNRPQPRYLARYASPLASAPAKPEPKSILLDVAKVRGQFQYVDPNTGDECEVDIEDACFELVAKTVAGLRTRVFSSAARVNGVKLKGSITFDPKRQRYEISSDELRRYVSTDSGRRLTLLDYLNATQEFSVLTSTPGIVYCEGTFFDPKIKLGAGFDSAALGLDGVFEPIPALQTIHSEKGAPGSATLLGWSPNTIFEWVDTHAADIVPNPQLLVCDDGKREVCDFILVGEDARGFVVAMIHAKASKTRNITGASKLQEVCGQAVKQVGMLNSFGAQKPPQVGLWLGTWEGPSGEGTVNQRRRVAINNWAGQDGNQIWDGLSKILRNQGTRREVVLVLGASLNMQALYQAARRPTPSPHAIHTIHLLRSAISTVSAAGARLRIFCD